MSFKIKQKNKTIEETFSDDEALYHVNKKLKEDDNELLEFEQDGQTYKVDFEKQEILINNVKKDLKLPKNSEKARWINFRRCKIDWFEDGTHRKVVTPFIGFQVSINNVNYKRMLKITGNKAEIVDES